MAADNWLKRNRLWLPSMGLGFAGNQPYPCPGCCDEEEEETCFYFQDDFTRGDSGDLGSDWSEEAGAWSISSSQLATDSSNAVATAQTDGTIPYVVQCLITGLSGDELRVIACYQDTNNYVFAELTYGATISTIRLFSRSGGVDTEAASQAFTHASGDSLTIKICVKNSVVQVDTRTSGAWTRRFTEYMTTATGTAGCGTGSLSITASFDNFSIQKHSETLEGCPDCKRECIRCIDNVAADAFQVVITGVTQGGGQDADCPNMNGTWVLTQIQNNGCVYRSNVQAWTTDAFCHPAGNWLELQFGSAQVAVCGDAPTDNYAISVYLSGVTAVCTPDCSADYFRHAQAAKYDCTNLNGLSIPPKSSANCTVTGATCLVTAL